MSLGLNLKVVAKFLNTEFNLKFTLRIVPSK